jgi:hypothetical protein
MSRKIGPDKIILSSSEHIKYKESNERKINKSTQSGYVQYLHISSSPYKLTTMCSKIIIPGNGTIYIFKITDCQLKYCMSNGIPFNPPMNSNSPPHNFIVNGVERQAIQSIAFNNNTGIIDFFKSRFSSNLSIYNTYLSVIFEIDVLSTNTQIQLPIIIVEKSVESCSKILQYPNYYNTNNTASIFIFKLSECQVKYLLKIGTPLFDVNPPQSRPEPPPLKFLANNVEIMSFEPLMFTGDLINQANTSWGLNINLPLGNTYLLLDFNQVFNIDQRFEII